MKLIRYIVTTIFLINTIDSIITSSLSEKKEDDDANRELVVQYLLRYGYINYHHNDRINDSISKLLLSSSNNDGDGDELSNGIKRVQQLYRMPVTGKINDEIIRIVRTPRCGMIDENLFDDSSVTSFSAEKGWLKLNLTWSLRNMHPRLPYDRQFTILRLAFKTWSMYSPFVFTEIPANDNRRRADIEIEFERNSRGIFPLLENMAYSSYPNPSDAPNGVYIRFNSAYTFTLDHDRTGMGFYKVTLHQIGHTLGLRHSSDPTSIMFFDPLFEIVYPYRIPNNEINKLRFMYRDLIENNSVDATTTTVSVTTNNNNDRNENDMFEFDGDDSDKKENDVNDDDNDVEEGKLVTVVAAVINGELFVFKNEFFWRSKISSNTNDRKALLLNKMFNFGKTMNSIDAIYQRQHDERIVIFAGKEYYVFNGRKLESGPNSVRDDFSLTGNVLGVYDTGSSKKKSKRNDSVIYIIDDTGTITVYNDAKRSVVKQIRTNMNADLALANLENDEPQHYHLSSSSSRNGSSGTSKIDYYKYFMYVSLTIISLLTV